MFANYCDGCCSLIRATEIIYFNKKYHKTILCSMLLTFLLCALKFHLPEGRKWYFGNFIAEPKQKYYNSLIWLCVLN